MDSRASEERLNDTGFDNHKDDFEISTYNAASKTRREFMLEAQKKVLS